MPVLVPGPTVAVPYAQTQQARCNGKLPGEEALLRRAGLKWLVVGEDHGTNQVPEAFSYLVCRLSHSRKVVVGVEISDLQQRDIDVFLSNDNAKAARTNFLKSPIWHSPIKDGRSSRAYFAMMERLRDLYRHGNVINVVALQPSVFGDKAAFERMMAQRAIDSARPGALGVILVGNLHAQIDAISHGTQSYPPMAAYLPRGATVTLDAITPGGMQWACLGPDKCGPVVIDHPHKNRPYGLHFYSKVSGGFSGSYNVRTPATASVPK
jgi:hypothetical protein